MIGTKVRAAETAFIPFDLTRQERRFGLQMLRDDFPELMEKQPCCVAVDVHEIRSRPGDRAGHKFPDQSFLNASGEATAPTACNPVT